jgi:hypothetical protein
MPDTCTGYDELQYFLDIVETTCCDEGRADCSDMGIPATCPVGSCRLVQLRFGATCDAFLKQPMNQGIKQVRTRNALCPFVSLPAVSHACSDHSNLMGHRTASICTKSRMTQRLHPTIT